MEYKKMNNFFKNHAENEAGRLDLDLFLFFKKALYELKARVSTNFCLKLVLNLANNETNCIKL